MGRRARKFFAKGPNGERRFGRLPQQVDFVPNRRQPFTCPLTVSGRKKGRRNLPPRGCSLAHRVGNTRDGLGSFTPPRVTSIGARSPRPASSGHVSVNTPRFSKQYELTQHITRFHRKNISK